MAKAIVGLVGKLFKVCSLLQEPRVCTLSFFQVIQEQQEFRDTAKDLAELLNVELNLANIIPDDLRSESVPGPLKRLMDVIAETLKFIDARMNRNTLSKPHDYSGVHIF